MAKEDLKNNPNYQNGYFWGKRMIPNISSTTYGTLKVGIESKIKEVAKLKREFLWTDEQKDVAEKLGCIAAWEEELLNQPKIIIEPINSQDIEEITLVTGDKITEEQEHKIISQYVEFREENPDETKETAIEYLLNEVKND